MQQVFLLVYKTKGVYPMGMADKQFPERLRKAMKVRGVTQAALAKGVNLKQQSVAYLCSKAGGSRSTPDIANYLKISATWLASGAGDMESAEAASVLDEKLLSESIKQVYDMEKISRTTFTDDEVARYISKRYAMGWDASTADILTLYDSMRGRGEDDE